MEIAAECRLPSHNQLSCFHSMKPTLSVWTRIAGELDAERHSSVFGRFDSSQVANQLSTLYGSLCAHDPPARFYTESTALLPSGTKSQFFTLKPHI